MPISLGTTTITAIFLGTTSISSAYLGSTQVFGGSFSPLSLFSGGAQGVWYDPSDLTTMFVDRAGTTPVTAPGQLVGRRLDKSGRGNHATAATDAARPMYGVEPKGGRRNLLTWSEDFTNAVWVKQRISVSANATAAPDGSITADKIISTTVTGEKVLSQDFTSVSPVVSVYAKAAEISSLTIFAYIGGSRTAVFNLTGAGSVTSTIGGVTATITSIGSSGWYRCEAVYSPGWSTTISYRLPTGTGNDVDGLFLWGAQLELGSTATPYQRVTIAEDVTEAGVPTCHYLRYDGANNSMSTSAIDFTATDKMSVFAGVRKTTNGNNSCIVELSATASSNNGAFCILTGRQLSGPAPAYTFISQGTVLVNGDTADAYNAPIENLLTFLGDISGDTAKLRANGIQSAQSTGNQGTGNFGNYPLFIGRRNNASLPFNGRDFGIVIVGKLASAGEIADTETWLAAKTSGVTL